MPRQLGAPARTHATAIKIGSPVSWKKALRSLELSDGWCDAVNEQEIADAGMGLDASRPRQPRWQA